MSAVQCLHRAGGLGQFMEQLFAMGWNKNGRMVLACDEEPWCLSGSDSSNGRSELCGESEVSDFSPITLPRMVRQAYKAPLGFPRDVLQFMGMGSIKRMQFFFSKPKTACRHSNSVYPSIPHKGNEQTKYDAQR